jgi:hypothetical protein
MNGFLWQDPAFFLQKLTLRTGLLFFGNKLIKIDGMYRLNVILLPKPGDWVMWLAHFQNISKSPDASPRW